MCRRAAALAETARGARSRDGQQHTRVQRALRASTPSQELVWAGRKKVVCPPSSASVVFPFCCSDISVTSCLHPQPSAGGISLHRPGWGGPAGKWQFLPHPDCEAWLHGLWGALHFLSAQGSARSREQDSSDHPSAQTSLLAQVTFSPLALLFKADLLLNHLSQEIFTSCLS